ncbi:MAG: recombinase family protein [Erysipelotrichia bacterium]|nr:recombinase family protein [Erysipelotrichia bacterium]
MSQQEYIIYLRKSRSDNPNETVEEVLERHERQLQEYAAKTFGYRISEENIYREVVSGETIDDRPQINAVFKRMENKNIKGVLVIEPQRLTRGDLLDCGTVVHLFRYSNTLIVTPTKTYNLEDKFDRKFFEMELTRGNDYLEYTKEILQRGRKASINEGNYISASAPYGYTKVKVNKKPTLAINEKEAKYVRLMYQWRLSGMGFIAICRKLEELGAKPRRTEHFGNTVIANMLSNELYIGKIRSNISTSIKEIKNGKVVKKRSPNENYNVIEGKHEAIIDEETFYKVQAINTQESRCREKYELVNPFAALIKCKCCGQSIMLKRYLRNGVEFKSSRYVCKNSFYCNTPSCTKNVITGTILKALKEHLNDFKVKIDNNNKDVIMSQKSIINGLKKDLERLESKQEELYNFLEDGIYSKDIFRIRNDKLAKERTRLEEALKKAEAYIPTVEEFQAKYNNLHNAIEMIEDNSIDAQTKNTFLKNVIKVIWYEKDESGIKIEIELK